MGQLRSKDLTQHRWGTGLVGDVDTFEGEDPPKIGEFLGLNLRDFLNEMADCCFFLVGVDGKQQ